MTAQANSWPESLSALIEEMAVIARFDIRRTNPFQILLRAALIKCYEYNLSVQEEVEDRHFIFFQGAALRGIAEEIIVIRYLATLPLSSQSELILSLMDLEMVKSTEAQRQFFTKKRPSQSVFSFHDPAKRQEEAKERIKNIRHSHKLNIRELAKSVGMEEFYEYIYHGTSTWVHFEAGMLYRMGWSESKWSPEYDLTITNFNDYYLAFIQFCGTYLFEELSQIALSEMNLSRDFKAVIDSASNWREQLVRWPELVTFEEMNRSGALSLTEILFPP